jgi:superfamily II DNA helicase RecQ
MPYKIFRIPARGCEASEKELNRFLASHSILKVEREFAGQGENSFWCFCVDYLERAATGERDRRSQIDYRETLKADEFTLFDELRDLRKQLAKEESAPVYAIFTNEQLAQIVRQRAVSLVALKKISGLGDARIEKYGARVVEIADKHWNRERKDDEAGVETV